MRGHYFTPSSSAYAFPLFSVSLCVGFAESQGFPRQPALERIYRQTGASLVQLGFLGVGAAVFADLQRELLD